MNEPEETRCWPVAVEPQILRMQTVGELRQVLLDFPTNAKLRILIKEETDARIDEINRVTEIGYISSSGICYLIIADVGKISFRKEQSGA